MTHGKRGEWEVVIVGGLGVLFLFLYYQQPNTVRALRWLGIQGAPAAYRDWNEYIVVSSIWLLWLPIL